MKTLPEWPVVPRNGIRFNVVTRFRQVPPLRKPEFAGQLGVSRESLELPWEAGMTKSVDNVVITWPHWPRWPRGSLHVQRHGDERHPVRGGVQVREVARQPVPPAQGSADKPLLAA